MSARSKKFVSVTPGIRQATVTPVFFNSFAMPARKCFGSHRLIPGGIGALQRAYT
jgi:hypothetical protein